MPAYEYLCRECGGHFERRQKMSDPEIESCPDCGGGVKRLISAGAGAITKSANPVPASGMCGTGGPCCGESACGMGRACLN